MKRMRNQKEQLFNNIRELCLTRITSNWISTNKTIKGNTQQSERVIIKKVKEVFNELLLTYEEAGTQQSKDFRNVGGIGLNIEIKKTDKSIVCFNDTCPSSEIYYIIFFTGKTYKKPSAKKINIPAQILFINGEELIQYDKEWLSRYNILITSLIDEFGRGENKKQLCGSGIMSVYPRKNYRGDISRFLTT
jgi:hypothetical protein